MPLAEGSDEAERALRHIRRAKTVGAPTVETVGAAPAAELTEAPPSRRPSSPALPTLVALVVAAAVARPAVESLLDAESLQSWSTIFVAITVQALPFLVLGVIVSGGRELARSFRPCRRA
jgi:hypothetical protein